MNTYRATVAYIGEYRPSKFAHEGRPDRAQVTFTTPSGSVTQWLEKPVVSQLAPGVSCTLISDGGKTCRIADVQPSASPSPFPPAPALNGSAAQRQAAPQAKRFEVPGEAERRNLLEYVKWNAKLYRTCYEEVVATMGEQEGKPDLALDKYNLKDIATTLFIGAQRKFNLQ
jgi:hypothetical protein